MGRGQSRRARLAALIILIVIAGSVVTHDLRVEPRREYGTRAALFAVDQYRAHISPRLRGIVRCRFKPSCSAYGRAAIEKYGLLRGGTKTAGRILRCGPWTPAGTIDRP